MPASVILLIIVATVVIIAICAATVVIQYACKNTQQQLYIDGNTIVPPNYGYTATQAGTFNRGNTHIWETPLPEPQDGGYTHPASTAKPLSESNTSSTLVN